MLDLVMNEQELIDEGFTLDRDGKIARKIAWGLEYIYSQKKEENSGDYYLFTIIPHQKNQADTEVVDFRKDDN